MDKLRSNLLLPFADVYIIHRLVYIYIPLEIKIMAAELEICAI